MADDLIPSATKEVGPGVRGSIRLQYARGGGPGGQNVNKLNTKAELWVAISSLTGLTEGALHRLATLAGRRLTAAGEIHLSSDTYRTQQMNRAAVFDRLREMIVAAQYQPKRRRKTRPTRASKQRRLDAKKQRGNIKAGRRYAGD
jgi:ribosome-associated protein